MKRTIFIALAVLTVSGFALGQAAMQGSKHDLGTGGPTGYDATNVNQICVFCHTPHQAFAAGRQDPLWNHTLSTHPTYGVYASDTLNADMSSAELGASPAGLAAVSNLCLSCHDGTVGVGSLYNDPNAGGTPNNTGTKITGNANLGTILEDDHPVNFTYDSNLATEDGELVTPSSSFAGNAPLFGGTVQCASCHDPHDDTYTPFLVVDNTDSALCAQCHLK